MGKVSDMLLDGTACANCGKYLHNGKAGPGYLEYCSEQCAYNQGADWPPEEDDYPVTPNED